MKANSEKVDRGFSSIYQEYEDLHLGNNKTVWQRNLVYRHVLKFVDKGAEILEINAGSGIDAVFLAKQGFTVLATDLSQGSEVFFKKKIASNDYDGRLTFNRLSYDSLKTLQPRKFDHVFSNFGGLNCVENPEKILNSLSHLLRAKGKVTVVIMPKLYPGEWILGLKNRKKAFRRLSGGPVMANVEGEKISVWYHSLKKLKKDLSSQFDFVKAESLGIFLPQNDNFGIQRPRIFSVILRLNSFLRLFISPGIGDYYIATFQKNSNEID